MRAGPRARLPPTPEGQCEDAACLQGPIPPITPSPGTSVCTSVNGTPIAHRTLPDRPRNCPHSSPPPLLLPWFPVEPHGAWNPTWQLRGRLGRDTHPVAPRPKAPVASAWHKGDTARTARAALLCAPHGHWPFSPLGARSLSPPRASALVLRLPGTLTPDLHRAPRRTGPFKCLSDLSRPNCPCARPWPRRSLCLMACLPSVLCSNHCPPDRVSLFTVCTSLPPSRLAGPPGKALSPVLCWVGHIAGAP